jgi:hypothetical protein
MAIGQKSWAPKNSSISIRLVRMSGQSLSFGIKEYKIAGTMVRVFSPAKTVADCFKFRNKIGLDVAIESLRESRRREKVSMDELWAAAKVCRLANVMRPYMESVHQALPINDDIANRASLSKARAMSIARPLSLLREGHVAPSVVTDPTTL